MYQTSNLAQNASTWELPDDLLEAAATAASDVVVEAVLALDKVSFVFVVIVVVVAVDEATLALDGASNMEVAQNSGVNAGSPRDIKNLREKDLRFFIASEPPRP